MLVVIIYTIISLTTPDNQEVCYQIQVITDSLGDLLRKKHILLIILMQQILHGQNMMELNLPRVGDIR